MANFSVNILGKRNGIQKSFPFDDEQKAIEKQHELENEGKRVEFVNLKYFPKRIKK